MTCLHHQIITNLSKSNQSSTSHIHNEVLFRMSSIPKYRDYIHQNLTSGMVPIY